ncbi:Phospholipase A1 member A [Camelus dromedarius]|uniref:Phospholipase A1 member A n=1 Tax=Camelus dromedarius TaxID=9838 RepID=A0A5N4EHW8_CAMDR|nr:Phospholipase A1 member A [Camelus dromedarius]
MGPCSEKVTGFSFQIWVFGFLSDMWTTSSTEAKTNLAVPSSFMQGSAVFASFFPGLVEQGGVKIEPLPKEVKVYLQTTSKAPYCVHHNLVEFYLQEPRNKDTCITVTFLGSNVTSSVKITIPRQQRHGKGVIAHPNPQCQINQVKLKFQASHRVWKKDRTTIIGKFCTAPLPVNDK